MAGIEKVCEYSGEGCGYMMYKWKRNHIQIKPEHRKLFKNVKCTLYITLKGIRYEHRTGWVQDASEHVNYHNMTEQQWLDYAGYRKIPEYYYILVVDDKKLFGVVEGVYLNWSSKIGTVKRKLKRMVGPFMKIKHLTNEEFDLTCSVTSNERLGISPLDVSLL